MRAIWPIIDPDQTKVNKERSTSYIRITENDNTIVELEPPVLWRYQTVNVWVAADRYNGGQLGLTGRGEIIENISNNPASLCIMYCSLSLSVKSLKENRNWMHGWCSRQGICFANRFAGNLHYPVSSNLHFIREDLIEGKVRVWRLEGGQGQVSVTDVLVNQSG